MMFILIWCLIKQICPRTKWRDRWIWVWVPFSIHNEYFSDLSWVIYQWPICLLDAGPSDSRLTNERPSCHHLCTAEWALSEVHVSNTHTRNHALISKVMDFTLMYSNCTQGAAGCTFACVTSWLITDSRNTTWTHAHKGRTVTGRFYFPSVCTDKLFLLSRIVWAKRFQCDMAVIPFRTSDLRDFFF